MEQTIEPTDDKAPILRDWGNERWNTKYLYNHGEIYILLTSALAFGVGFMFFVIGVGGYFLIGQALGIANAVITALGTAMMFGALWAIRHYTGVAEDHQVYDPVEASRTRETWQDFLNANPEEVLARMREQDPR